MQRSRVRIPPRMILSKQDFQKRGCIVCVPFQMVIKIKTISPRYVVLIAQWIARWTSNPEAAGLNHAEVDFIKKHENFTKHAYIVYVPFQTEIKRRTISTRNAVLVAQ